MPLDLAMQLLKRTSISPNDAGCQELISDALLSLGFHLQSLHFGKVHNLWAQFGAQRHTLLFIGHTDVVPPGPREQWKFDPFTPTIAAGKLYARGAADMKVAIACMIAASKRFLKTILKPNFNIAFLLTSCEEANTEDGTEKAIKVLIEEQHQHIDWCIVGEPSSHQILGDYIKVGRRGSLHGTLTIHGKQGHIAYPHLAENPIHRIAPFLQALTEITWDEGNAYFDPTSLQISNIHSGSGSTNVIPGKLELLFNFRYSPLSTVEKLQNTVEALLKKYRLTYSIQWLNSANPFQSSLGILHRALQSAIHEVNKFPAVASTSGGTSDARFIVPYGVETIECGFPNSTIHQVNEHIDVADIEKLTEIYYVTLLKLHYSVE